MLFNSIIYKIDLIILLIILKRVITNTLDYKNIILF